jgi:hypothetical protein
MIVAVVVGVIITVFVLALLLVSYSLFYSVTQHSAELQCRELAVSLDEEIRKELTTPDYETYEAEQAAEGHENQLWFFLRNNLWQGTVWPYYHEGESGHGKAESYRYFTVDITSDDRIAGMADQVLVTMYWEIYSDEPQLATDKGLTGVHIKVCVEKDKESYELESAYDLSVGYYVEPEEAEGESGEGVTEDEDAAEELHEKWIWTRE